jgi:hypothetical protein
VISRSEDQLGIHGLVQSFLELQKKFGSSSEHNPLGHCIKTNYPRRIQLCQLRSGVGHLDGYEVSYLGQWGHGHPDRVISKLSPGHSHYGIHSNHFPLPLRYSQGLQHSSRSSMLGFNSLTGITKSNILDDISPYAILPISGLEIMVHLIPPCMNGISGLVSLT